MLSRPVSGANGGKEKIIKLGEKGEAHVLEQEKLLSRPLQIITLLREICCLNRLSLHSFYLSFANRATFNMHACHSDPIASQQRHRARYRLRSEEPGFGNLVNLC